MFVDQREESSANVGRDILAEGTVEPLDVMFRWQFKFHIK